MLAKVVRVLTFACNRSRWEERQVDHVLHWRGARAGAGWGARAGAEGERIRGRGAEEVPDDDKEEDAQRIRRLLPRRYPDPQGSDKNHFLAIAGDVGGLSRDMFLCQCV